VWYRCLVYIPPWRRFVFKGLQLRHIKLFCTNSKFMHSMWNSHQLSTSVLFWTWSELCQPPTSSSWTAGSDYAIMSSRSSVIFFGINSSFSWSFCKISIMCWQPCGLSNEGMLSSASGVTMCSSCTFYRGRRLRPGIRIGSTGSACTRIGDLTWGALCFEAFWGLKKLKKVFDIFSGCGSEVGFYNLGI